MYADISNVPAVYEIVNTVNQKRYIGSSYNCRKRIVYHLSFLRRGSHHSKYLQRSWDKHGENSFVVNILETPLVNELLQREQHYMDLLKPEYNSSPTAGSCLGYKLSSETKERMSKAHKGRIKTPEHRESLSKSLQGRKLSDESIAKMRKSLKGRTVWNKGVSPSAETRQKLREHNLGNKHTLETRQKMSDSLKGRIITPEHAEKIGDAQRGEKNHKAKLTTPDVVTIKQMLADKKRSQKEIADLFSVTRSTIAAISQGLNWGHVNG